MAKLYRTLAMVAIAALVGYMLYLLTEKSGIGAAGPTGFGDGAPTPTFAYVLFSMYSAVVVKTIEIGTPVVASFAFIVAGQSRRWGWLVAFLILGLVAVYGETLLTIYFLSENPSLPGFLQHPLWQLAPHFLPPLAALIFAWQGLRTVPSAQTAPARPGRVQVAD